MSAAKKGMDQAQESANNETKSSAGDKYETSRALSQAERDMFAKQYAEWSNANKILQSIQTNMTLNKVELGAVVETSQNNYFLSVGLGKQKLGDFSFIALSPASPLGQALIGKKQGEQVFWLKNEIEIISIT